jgi:hypothetical protein
MLTANDIKAQAFDSICSSPVMRVVPNLVIEDLDPEQVSNLLKMVVDLVTGAEYAAQESIDHIQNGYIDSDSYDKIV